MKLYFSQFAGVQCPYIKFIIIVGSQNIITNTIAAARVKLCPAGAWLVLSVISLYPWLSWHHTQTYFIDLPWVYCINAIIAYVQDSSPLIEGKTIFGLIFIRKYIIIMSSVLSDWYYTGV